MQRFVYLDYQATTPIDKEVFQAMLPYLTDKFGNPSSLHKQGIEADLAVSKARGVIASGLEVNTCELFFTSGASEANNLAIKGIARSRRKGHIISVRTEHKSVLEPVNRLQREGFAVTLLPVNSRGLVDPNRLESEIRKDTILVSVMLGNNETGVLHPLQEIGEITNRRNIPLHCDVTQSIGYQLIKPKKMDIDMMTFSGHKIYGPKGIGAFYVSNRLLKEKRILPEIEGGGQESGMRGGTQNVPAIIGLRKAYELSAKSSDVECFRQRILRDGLLNSLAERVDFICNTPLESALPHCVNLSFPGINNQSFLQSISDLALSTGSACNSGSQTPSHVLLAMGLPGPLIDSSIRLSVGRFTTQDDVDYAADRIATEVRACQRPRLI